MSGRKQDYIRAVDAPGDAEAGAAADDTEMSIDALLDCLTSQEPTLEPAETTTSRTMAFDETVTPYDDEDHGDLLDPSAMFPEGLPPGEDDGE